MTTFLIRVAIVGKVITGFNVFEVELLFKSIDSDTLCITVKFLSNGSCKAEVPLKKRDEGSA